MTTIHLKKGIYSSHETLCIITYSIEQNPSWEANQFSASQEIPPILCNQKVHYREFTRVCHLSLFWARSIQYMPQIPCLKFHLNIILPSMPGFSTWSLSIWFPHQTQYAPLLSPICTACPAHPILLGLVTWIIFGEEYRSLSSSFCSFNHSPVTSSSSGPNILLTTPFSNTLSLHSSPNFSGQVSHPNKTTGKIVVMYNLYIFGWLTGRPKILHPTIARIPDFDLLLLSSWIEFWFIRFVLKYLNCSTLSKELLSTFIVWLCPAFWSWNMTTYLISSEITASPISLLATTKAFVLSFVVCMLLPNILTSSSKLQADVYHLISSHPGLPKPS